MFSRSIKGIMCIPPLIRSYEVSVHLAMLHVTFSVVFTKIAPYQQLFLTLCFTPQEGKEAWVYLQMNTLQAG